MNKNLILIALLFIPLMLSSQSRDLKVFISVDMEGVASVVSSQHECQIAGHDYGRIRRIMTEETNAAVEGALEAGAAEIVVRDGHGSKINIIPELLHEKALLMRGVTNRPENMMLGIDNSFDAVILIGYHAKASTEDGVIAHTSSGNVVDLSVNGISLPEAGYNALLAGLHDVPVILVVGDNWICGQCRDLFGNITKVETKKGFGSAALCLHPEKVQRMIKEKTVEALQNRDKFKPFKLEPPYRMVLKVKKMRGDYPGAKKLSKDVYEFISDDFLKVMDAFNTLK